jgi:hypothetical protein
MLTISIKIPSNVESRVSAALTDYRLRNIRRSEEVLLEEVRNELTNRNMRVTDDLYESFEVVDLEETSDITRTRVGSDDVAASVAEYGAKPAGGGAGGGSGDMFEAILQWIKDKPVIPSYGTEADLAFAITRKIAQQGQPLHGGLKRPFHNAQKRAQRRINKLWIDDMEQLGRDLDATK